MSRILIIDDDERLLETLRIGLEARGYAVLTAESGNSGFQLATQNPPDLILSDVNMRDGDGYAALNAFRNDPKTAAIPFIMMTVQATPVGMRTGMEMGADDYLPKPFSIKAAVAAIGARLKQRETIQKKASEGAATLQKNLTLMLPHELRTPLTTIMGVGSLLASSAAELSDSDVASFGEMLVTSANRLHRLIENFLLYARLENLATDPSNLNIPRPEESIDLRATIEKAAQEKAKFAERPEDLKLNITDTCARISGEFLGKIVEELVGNGFKFSEPGTPVELRTKRQNKVFSLQVIDIGRGMVPEETERIGAFMQFQRNIHEQQGTGLGLAIIRRLVNLHAGRFEITSSTGAGATVTITIPD